MINRNIVLHRCFQDGVDLPVHKRPDVILQACRIRVFQKFHRGTLAWSKPAGQFLVAV